MARYLVTGGAGFIGSHLCEHLLAGGHNVVVLDDLSTGKRSNLPESVTFIEGDIRNADTVLSAMKGASGCFHLAAIASVAASNERWVETHQINLSATINIFEAAKQHGRLPVVYTSSAAVYGEADNVPLIESTPTRPLTAYGADKLGCELHAVPGWRVHGVPSTGLRLFNVYGPRQDPSSPYSGVISIFADRFKNNQPITIHGDGSQSRDFIFVKDVCRAFLAAMANTEKGCDAINVCTGEETSILQLAETLARVTGYEGEFKFGPQRTGDIPRSLGDNSKLIQELGISPKTKLIDGLRETIGS